MQPLQWIKFDPLWPVVLAFSLTGSLASLAFSWWFLPLVIFIAWRNAVYWSRVRDFFRRGDCNPGLVLQERPLRIAIATDMRVESASYPALKVVEYAFRFRGSKALRVGEIVPTVALYSWDGTANPRFWVDFTPLPVQCATANASTLAAVKNSFPDEAIKFLRMLISKSHSLEPGLYWFHPRTFEPRPMPSN